MNIKIPLSNFNKKGAVAFSFFWAFAFAAMLHAASIFDIEYPIAELGNCANGQSCKAYCAVADHEQTCEDFAAQYGIGSAAEHKKDIQNLVTDGGPGNCATGAEDPESSCKTYCDSQAHIRECVAYGKEHNLLQGKELAEAEKVIKALDSGAKLPAGCTNKDSCRQTCEDPKDLDTARQCFLFAEQAGLLPPGVDRDKAEKTFQLIAEGKAPFKSIKDFKQCDNPRSDEILQKCIGFAADNGLMSPEEARIVKETGGKGPGGCVGRAQCDAYCESHQDECFQFAQDHNLMRPEDRERMEAGVGMLKQSYEGAPSEVKQCISQGVGDDILNQILSGQKMPSREIGNTMRTCFESVFKGRIPQNASSTMGYPGGEGFGAFPMQGGFPGQGGGQDTGRPPRANFSPEVEACIVSKVGEEGLNKVKHPIGRPDQTLGAVISWCFSQIEGPRTGPGGCSTPEECKNFCSDPVNAEKCNVPSVNSGMRSEQVNIPPAFDGRMRYGSSTGPQNYPQNFNYSQGGYYQGMPRQDMPPVSGNYPDRPMTEGQYIPGQYPGQYPMPPQDYIEPEGTPGMYAPPGGEMVPPPSGVPTEPPPPTSLLLGVKNFASVIFSLILGHQ